MARSRVAGARRRRWLRCGLDSSPAARTGRRRRPRSTKPQGDGGDLLRYTSIRGPTERQTTKKPSTRRPRRSLRHLRASCPSSPSCPYKDQYDSGSSRELPRFGVHLHLLAFLDEERHAQLHAGFEDRDLRHVAGRRVAADARLGGLDLQLDVRRELERDGPAVELVDLHLEVVDEEVPILAGHLGRERERLERLLVHEVVAVGVRVEERRWDFDEVGLVELVAGLEGP